MDKAVRYPQTGGTSRKYTELSSLIQQGDTITLTLEDVITFFSNIDTPGFRQVLGAAIASKTLYLDESLVEVLAKAGSMESVYTIAMLLRMGSNPNNYYADIHPLAVLYNNWKSGKFEARLNMITILMIYYGCNPILPIRPGKDVTRSTLEWINVKGYPNMIDRLYPGYACVISQDTMLDLAILIGSEENIGVSQVEENSIKKIITAGSNSLLSLGIIPREIEGMDHNVIYWSIEYYNSEAFKYYVSMGYKMSYPMTNTIILRIGQYTRNKESVFLGIYLDILSSAINNGQLLDSHQQSLLMASSSQGYQSIMKSYQVPYWEKACNYKSDKKTDPPTRLSILASAIDMDMNNDHDMICRAIKSISDVDPDDIVKAASVRQKHRMSARHATIQDYLASDTPILDYYNVSPADGDLNNYIDVCTVSYRDSGGRIWGFLSRDYNLILDKGLNPVNGDKVPQYMIDEIRSKIARMKSANMSQDKAITHRDILDQLIKTDTANNELTEIEKTKFMMTMAEEGVSQKQLETLTSLDLDAITKKAGYNSTIRLLDQPHALVTTAYIVNYFLSKNSTKGKLMVQYIKSLIYTDNVVG